MNASELTKLEKDFIRAFNDISEDVCETAHKSGWWRDRDALIAAAAAISPELERFAKVAVSGLGIALKHSELSEALEGIRHGNPPDDKVPEFTSEEAEYADEIIRIMDTGEKRNLRIAEAVIAKARMNKTRAFMHGGKLA